MTLSEYQALCRRYGCKAHARGVGGGHIFVIGKREYENWDGSIAIGYDYSTYLKVLSKGELKELTYHLAEEFFLSRTICSLF